MLQMEPEQPAAAFRKDAAVTQLVEAEVEALLTHPYFAACHAGTIGREQLVDIVEQLYCFSVFFERIITLRVARYTSRRNQELARIARLHLKEEIGHAELFRRCLVENGMTPAALDAIAPKMFTKAVFGYLMATIEYENEYVGNVAIMQVMETIGYHFFGATLKVIEQHQMLSQAFVEHSAEDEGHALLGLECYRQADDGTLRDCRRVVTDLFRLMRYALDEWLGVAR